MIEQQEPEELRTTVCGCDTYVLRSGKGPTVLYLHGDRGGSEWTTILQRLATNFDVVAPDHPGMGHSSSPDWIDNIHDMAYFYLQLIKALDLRDVHVIGSSLGGWIAMEMAVRSTERLRSLTLVGTTGIYLDGTDLPDQFLMTNEELVRTLFVDQSRADVILATPQTDEQMDRFLRNRHISARLGWTPRFHDPHLEKWLPTVDIPTLIGWGRHDALFPVTYGERLAKLFPNSELTIFENSGHLPQVEEAERFSIVFEQFTRGVQS
ncbi:pimeloyl-ACP methyl ester carboxylesterase [Paraburkholderia sp. BL27I4N3]|uniref:alpha/beta fold hydrolase n=1 Tax=Paraburkholderia sp. BL27I4N3 TaxID=1938805 RepID=UPI000E246DC9|nr:alpha/beta hydrolase [Paraburkholderia sp. BL27I4N3]REE07475.1 pimeloyl-ACP methyl ester carboxylesterase [Paraburkholderia sp. BL27I4N3]